jgi:Fur family ferric uptake transcriptional regulator
MEKKAREFAEGILKKRGLKKTEARLLVLEYFLTRKEPAGAQEVAGAFKKIDQATIYRTIQTLTDEHVLRKVNLRHDHADYEIAGQSDHHHIVCTVCGEVEEFEGCGGEEMVKKVLKQSKMFTKINDHAIELFGVCKNCA